VKQLIRTESALNPTGFLLLGGGVQEQVELGSGCVMEGGGNPSKVLVGGLVRNSPCEMR
jgi:hypothetical protein